MNTVYLCGKRGLGDIVASLSWLLDHLQTDSHIVFNYPNTGEYEHEERFRVLIKEFACARVVSWEWDSSWSSVNLTHAQKHFAGLAESQQWFFSDRLGYGIYRPFLHQWKGNRQGPVALALNYQVATPHPLSQKWFPENVNNLLMSLVDNKNYFLLGSHISLMENISIISNCSKIIGIDTAWAHVSNSMRTPYLLCKNQWNTHNLLKFYKNHPCLAMIDAHQIFDYLL